jgi:sugar phosphate isomerase/epimerase
VTVATGEKIMLKMPRRKFMQSLTAAVTTPSMVLAPKQPKRLPISFSTLGCPKWDWKTILKNASAWGYAAIELRGVQGELDLTKRPEFSNSRLTQSLKELEALDLRISNLGSSAHLHESDPAKRSQQMDEGTRFIDLAHRLLSPYVRVFGDKVDPAQPRQATIDRVVAGLRELGEYARGSKVTVILESHGDFYDSPTLLQVMKDAEMPTVGLLWYAYHTCTAGNEDPASTFKQLGSYVRHTHLKDSVPAGKEEHYVLTGTGTVPVKKTVKVLVDGGYRGYYNFEWEKLWHPEIEEPEIAIPHFAKVIREYLAEAGLKA